MFKNQITKGCDVTVNGKEFGHILKLKSLAGEGFRPIGERLAEEQRGQAGRKDPQQTMEGPHPVMRACGEIERRVWNLHNWEEKGAEGRWDVQSERGLRKSWQG